jgi:hypothetical protein
MNKTEINNQINVFKNELLCCDKAFFQNYSLDNYLSKTRSASFLQGYYYIDPELKIISDNIMFLYGARILALYHKLALSKLTDESLQDIRLKRMPQTVQDLYMKWVERVCNDFCKRGDTFYSYQNDSFLKDLAVCSLRMIPVGAVLVELSGISRRFLFKGGLRQLIEALVFAIYKTKGFVPFYEMHTDRRYVKDFTPEKWKQSYLNIAELLESNSKIKGVSGGSWFFDPNLEEISPELSYLRQLPTDNGAMLFRVGTTRDDIRNATGYSWKRRALYKKGKYTPTGYLLIWGRKQLLQWADRQ